MERLQTASDAVRRATEALVKAAQKSVQKPVSPRIKVDRFKQVIIANNSNAYISSCKMHKI